jgi:hypothetical protein
MKSRLMLSAAIAVTMAAGLYGCGQAASAKAFGPNKIAALITGHKFKIDDMKRKGATYVVVADGPKGNKVQFVVDAKDGKVKGMDVIKWAPGAKRVTRNSHGDDFFDEFYEFGVTVPAAVYATWTDYSETQWEDTSESSEEIELTSEESSEEVSTEEVSYEENIQEENETTAEEETVEASTDESSSEDSAESSSSDEAAGSDDSAGASDDSSSGGSDDSSSGSDDSGDHGDN